MKYKLTKGETDYFLHTIVRCIRISKQEVERDIVIKDLIESEFANELGWQTYLPKKIDNYFKNKKYKLNITIEVVEKKGK